MIIPSIYESQNQMKQAMRKQYNLQSTSSAQFFSTSAKGSSLNFQRQMLYPDIVFRQAKYSSLFMGRETSWSYRSTLAKTFSKGYFCLSERKLCRSSRSMGKWGFILPQKELNDSSYFGFLLTIYLITYPKTERQPPSASRFLNFTSGASPGKKCRACPTVTRSYFSSSGKPITSHFANSTSIPAFFCKNAILACSAASSMFLLISTPLLLLKCGARANKSCPVPVATSRQRFLWVVSARQRQRKEDGYLGLNLSQFMPWVLKPKASMPKLIYTKYNPFTLARIPHPLIAQ